MRPIAEFSDAYILRLAIASERRGRDASAYWSELEQRFGTTDREAIRLRATPSGEPWVRP